MARPASTMSQPGPGSGTSTSPMATTMAPTRPMTIRSVSRPALVARIRS